MTLGSRKSGTTPRAWSAWFSSRVRVLERYVATAAGGLAGCADRDAQRRQQLVRQSHQIGGLVQRLGAQTLDARLFEDRQRAVQGSPAQHRRGTDLPPAGAGGRVEGVRHL